MEYSIEIWNWGYPFGVATKWVQDWTHTNLGPQYVLQHGHAELAHRATRPSRRQPNIPLVRLIGDQHFNPETFRQACEMIDSRKYHFDAVCTAPYADPSPRSSIGPVRSALGRRVRRRQAAGDGHRVCRLRADHTGIDTYCAKKYKDLADKHGMKMYC